MIKTIELIKDLEKVKNQIQKIPSKRLYDKYGHFSSKTYECKFGSWNDALIKCFGEVVRIKPPNKSIIICPICQKETKNPKYCSRSCAVKINNSLFPKNPRRKFCSRCKKYIRAKSDYCKQCYSFLKTEQFGEKTIQDISTSYGRHKYQKIREHAHRVAKYYNIKRECPFCNYNNHFQLCHIKDIQHFPKNTKLKIVNDPKNLIFLCPNHHWDLDHGFLKL